MSANVLALGGGFGGWTAAIEIRNRLPENHRVMVADRGDSSCLGLSSLRLMTGDREADRISRPFSMLERNVVRDITGRSEAAVFDGRGACSVETGDGLTAYGEGKFYEDAVPNVVLHPPAPKWHDSKIRYEKEWLEGGIRSDDDFRRTG